jgi:hypothetical protein
VTSRRSIPLACPYKETTMLRFIRKLFCVPHNRSCSRRCPSVRPSLEQLEGRLVPSVTRGPGPVLDHVEVETVFVGDAWQTNPYLAQQAQSINQFFAEITNSTYMDMLAEYGIGRGSLRQQDFIPQVSAPGHDATLANYLTDQSIQYMLNINISDPNSTVNYPDANTVYFVFTQPGVSVDVTSINHWAGYHTSFIDDRNELVNYAVVPYPRDLTAEGGLSSFDQITATSSHELAEAATDPTLPRAWFDATAPGGEGEIADLADGLQGRYLGYQVQPLWSNVQQTAVLPPDATWTTWADMTVGPNNVPAAAAQITHSYEYYGDFVTAAYQRYLGRSPAASEVYDWAVIMQHGLTDERLEAGFIGSPEYIANHGGPGAGWVAGMYHDLLGRTPSPLEVNAWVDHLRQGESTQDVAYGFAASFERESQRVQADYQTFLGRAASDTEVANWATAFEQGMTNEDVVTGFLGSFEYFANHNSTVNDWLNAAYTDVLHRPIDDASLQMWDAALL